MLKIDQIWEYKRENSLCRVTSFPSRSTVRYKVILTDNRRALYKHFCRKKDVFLKYYNLCVFETWKYKIEKRKKK